MPLDRDREVHARMVAAAVGMFTAPEVLSGPQA